VCPQLEKHQQLDFLYEAALFQQKKCHVRSLKFFQIQNNSICWKIRTCRSLKNTFTLHRWLDGLGENSLCLSRILYSKFAGNLLNRNSHVVSLYRHGQRKVQTLLCQTYGLQSNKDFLSISTG
jgi:hypothetical protein